MNGFFQNSMLRILILCILSSFTTLLWAQTSGDKLYSQGLELQKKQTVQSQRAAIAKFTSAKKLYDSAAKKKQCDDAIMVSNNIIKTIMANQEHNVGMKDDKNANLVASVLELSNEHLQLNCESHSVTVKITTTEPEWNVTPITNDDGMAFVSIEKNVDEQSFMIICTANPSTRQRKQSIEVRSGTLKRTLLVEQSGKPTILSVEKTVIEFSNKGGSKSIEVYSNSDSVEEENNNRNWKVVSKPDWINVVGEEMKVKGAWQNWETKQ